MEQNNQNSKAHWLEALILSAISADKEGDYVYSITCKLGQKFKISESTIYPICRRMKDKNWVSTYDKNCEGRIRKYYKATVLGRLELTKYQGEWLIYRELINEWLCEEVHI